MNLEDKINLGRRQFLVTMSKGGVYMAAAPLLTQLACGEEAPPDGGCTSNSQCREPRVCYQNECVQPEQVQDAGNDTGENGVLLYDDFRRDSGLWEIGPESSLPEPAYNYTSNGLEFRNYFFGSNERFQFPREGTLNFEYRWKVPFEYEGNLLGIHFLTGNYGLPLTPANLRVESEKWYTTKATITSTEAIISVIEGTLSPYEVDHYLIDDSIVEERDLGFIIGLSAWLDERFGNSGFCGIDYVKLERLS